MNTMLQNAKTAKYEIGALSSAQKNDALYAMADALVTHQIGRAHV